MDSKQRDTLIRTQAFERWLHQNAKAVLHEYNQHSGFTFEEVQLYVDPYKGKLCCDVVLGNGARLPLLLDVDPDWENKPDVVTENLGHAHQDAAGQAAQERSRWSET